MKTEKKTLVYEIYYHNIVLNFEKQSKIMNLLN